MRGKLLVGAVCLAMLGSTAPVWADGAKTFGNRDLKGNYAEKFSGFVQGTTFNTGDTSPQSGTGILIADGNGNFTAGLVFSIGGKTCSGNVSGTYHVNADGTGTSTGTFTPDPHGAPSGIPASNYMCPPQVTGVQDEAFTIVGTKVDFISTDADSVVSGTAERQQHHGGHD